MSLSLRDECRIVLRPDYVVLAKLRRELARSGLRRQVRETLVAPCEPSADEKKSWGGALAALDAALPDFADRKSPATVILSNHFMRYAMVPWSDVLDDEAEELAYARYSFGELYGGEAGEWELRISPSGVGMPQLASAVDAGLAGALREIFGRREVRLQSVQPHLMMAYNACRATLRGQSAWLALVEQGNLCLAWLHRGHCSWIRTMRIGHHWRDELPFLLSREAMVADIGVGADDDGANDVFLWAPDCRNAPLISDGPWRIMPMRPRRMPDAGLAHDSRFAMYLSE